MKITGICKHCLGCNKLEDLTFKGVSKCKNAIIYNTVAKKK